MERRKDFSDYFCVLAIFFFFLFWTSVSCLLTPKGVNYEVQALMGIKNSLKDPHDAFYNWDADAVDPCSWALISCSSDHFVTVLGFPSQNLSGTLSPCIGNLSNLQTVLLQDNNISGPIPSEIGKLKKLETLDLSDNFFTGLIPDTLSHMDSLHYLRLDNNSLIGAIPSSLANMTQLAFLDISHNNLSGPVPKINAKTFNIAGNPQIICGTGTEKNCSRTTQLASNFNNASQEWRWSSKEKKQKIGLAYASIVTCTCLLFLGLGFLVWWRQRYNKQIFLDDNEEWQLGDEVWVGSRKRFELKEVEAATSNFSKKNLIGKGGYGNVYKGYLPDGTVIAVKRLKDNVGIHNNGNNIGTKNNMITSQSHSQILNEIHMITLAVHRNILPLYGFCLTPSESLLLYPYMPNGSLASRLKAKPSLEWSTRKRIALGAARGLVYLHEQCEPKIVHGDVKAGNILLDEDCEAVIGDFGLAKQLEHRVSHVTTVVRGTVGHIAPEYLATGQFSDKADVFAFGILLLELISGHTALEFGKLAGKHNKGHNNNMLDWVKKMHQDKKLDLLVDKELRNKYDRIEVQEMLQVALLCTQYVATLRPNMSQVVRMLAGDGLVHKWEASSHSSHANHLPLYFSETYSHHLTHDSSLLNNEAMELSGPR